MKMVLEEILSGVEEDRVARGKVFFDVALDVVAPVPQVQGSSQSGSWLLGSTHSLEGRWMTVDRCQQRRRRV